MVNVLAAAVYARISQDRAGDGLGVARQIEDCEAEAVRRGWIVAEVYVDDDVSAYSGKVRPGYRHMLDDLAGGHRDAVLVWHMDRLHRRPIELEEFARVCDAAGARVATLHGDVDFGTGDGLLVARIMAAVAANESDAKGRRVRRKMDEIARAGRPHGGRRPFGFESDRVTIRESEAAVIRVLAARFLAGESLTSLSGWLDETGVATTHGAVRWARTVVRSLLRSGRICGMREHRGEIIGPATWPAIVSVEDGARMRAILDDPSRRTSRTARRYLLAGVLRCHLCGTTLRARPQDGRRRYECSRQNGGCARTCIVADRVEELIVDAVLFRLDTPDLADALAGRNAADAVTMALAGEVAADQAQLDELAGLYAARRITAGEWMLARNPIEARLADGKRRLTRANDTAHLDGWVGNGDGLRGQWAELGLSRQAAVIRSVLDHAVIGPGTSHRFDPNRVHPAWAL